MIFKRVPEGMLDLLNCRAGLAMMMVIALSSVGCAGSIEPVARPAQPEAPGAWHSLDRHSLDRLSTDRHSSDRPAEDSARLSTLTPDAEVLASWWRQLGDPVLDELVAKTLAGNLDLQTAAARVQEARARRGLAKADLGPSVAAGFDARTAEPLGDGVALTGESYSGSLTASWEADLFGAKRKTLAASEADLAAGEAELQAARVSLVAEVVVAYVDLRSAEARLRVIDDNLDSRRQTFELTDFREKAGLASRLEVDQALSSREQARASRATGELLAESARYRLELLAGVAPGRLGDTLGAAVNDPALVGTRDEEIQDARDGDALPAVPEFLTVGLPAEALGRRPDVRAASHRLEAALARLGVAEAARYPTLRLTGSIDGQSTDIDDLFDVDTLFANLLAGLTAPIFESGRIERNIDVEKARVQQEVLGYRAQILQALSEVETALASLHWTGQQIEALDGAVEAAQEAVELADQRYSAGLIDLLVVLDTQRTLLSLEEQRVAARGERVVAFSNLYRALGGGWQSTNIEPGGEENA